MIHALRLTLAILMLPAGARAAREARRQPPPSANAGPANPRARLDAGIALWAHGRRAEAAAVFGSVLGARSNWSAEDAPAAAKAHDELGSFLWERGGRLEALAHYEEAVRIDPALGESYDDLGLVLLFQKRDADAAAYFREALRRAPGLERARAHLALALKRSGRDPRLELRGAGSRFAVYGWGFATLEGLNRLRVAAACCGVLLLAVRRRLAVARYRRAWLGLAVAAGVLWCGDEIFHMRPFLHIWDIYATYMGAKYMPELGYTRLYQCVAAADAENGDAEVRFRPVRNLTTNEIQSGAASPDDARACVADFTPRRWRDFKHDVAYFRAEIEATGTGHWAAAELDYGVNTTPVYSVLARPLADLWPASRRSVAALSALDLLFIAAMWVLVWRTFGWEAWCVAFLFWATNEPARYEWTYMTFLREDWLALTIAGICLLKRRSHGWAGACLTYAAALRGYVLVIPCFLIARELTAAAWTRDRGPLLVAPWLRRFVAGCVAAGIAAILLGTAVNGRSWAVWPEFYRNAAKYVKSPMTNRMGLKTAFRYAPEAARAAMARELAGDDPGLRGLSPRALNDALSKRVRDGLYERRRFYFYPLAALLTAWIFWAARGRAEWEAAVLGALLIAVWLEVNCYYYAVFLACGLLIAGSLPHAAAALCLASALSRLVPMASGDYDTIYAAISVVMIAMAASIPAFAGTAPGESPTPESPP